MPYDNFSIFRNHNISMCCGSIYYLVFLVQATPGDMPLHVGAPLFTVSHTGMLLWKGLVENETTSVSVSQDQRQTVTKTHFVRRNHVVF